MSSGIVVLNVRWSLIRVVSQEGDYSTAHEWVEWIWRMSERSGVDMVNERVECTYVDNI